MDIHSQNEMMNFYIFILLADEFICSKLLLGKSKVKIAFYKCQRTSYTYIDNSHEDEMMNFYIFILLADEFICSKWGKAK